MRIVLSILFLINVAQICSAQKQLVLLRGQDVLHRMKPGDDFVYRLKSGKTVKRSYVNNLSDTAVVTHRDTVPFRKIDRIYFQRTTRANVIGTAVATGGALLFFIDQINYSAIQGNDFSIDRGVATASVAAVVVGLPFMLIKKKSQKIKSPYRLRMVGMGSVFYED